MTSEITDPISCDTFKQSGSTIGHLRKTPMLLDGIFTEVMRQLYNSADNGYSLRHNWQWAEKPEAKSHVWINSAYVWNDAEPDFRPAIYTALSPIAYSNVTGRQRARTGMNLEEGHYHYGRFGKGNVTYAHIGRTQGETQELVSNSLDLLDAFSDIIRQDFCFRTLNVIQVVPSRVSSKEPRERFRGEVILEYTFEDTWSLKLESPKLQRIVFKAGLNVSGMLDLEQSIM